MLIKNAVVNNNMIILSGIDFFTSNSVADYGIRFSFTDNWQNMVKVAVFQKGNVSIEQPILTQAVQVPTEMLQDATPFILSVRGVENGIIRTTTVKSVEVFDGTAQIGSDPVPITKSYGEMIQRSVLEMGVSAVQGTDVDVEKTIVDDIINLKFTIPVSGGSGTAYDDTEIREEIADTQKGVINNATAIELIDKDVDDLAVTVQDLDDELDSANTAIAYNNAQLVTLKNKVDTDIKDVSYNESTGVLTFTKQNSTIQVVDLPIENIVSSGSYDEVTKELVLNLVSGEEIRIPVSGLIDDYTGLDGDNIQINISADNIISAVLKNRAVSKSHLTDELVAELDAKLVDSDLAIYQKNNKPIVSTVDDTPISLAQLLLNNDTLVALSLLTTVIKNLEEQLAQKVGILIPVFSDETAQTVPEILNSHVYTWNNPITRITLTEIESSPYDAFLHFTTADGDANVFEIPDDLGVVDGIEVDGNTIHLKGNTKYIGVIHSMVLVLTSVQIKEVVS
ncbi:MAG: hypothetical protein R3Y09_06685 [Clostridia bacterium]